MNPDSERDFAQRPSATDRERAGRRIDTATEIPPKMRQARHFFTEAEVAEGWQGTTPAEGTRRKLIFDTLLRQRLDNATHPERILELADEIEAALLQSVIDDEAMVCGAEALTDGIVEVDPEANRMGRSVAGEEAAKALNHLIIARRECVDPADLARINEAITAAHMVVEPPSYTATAEAVDREVGEEPPAADDAPGGDDPAATIKYLEGEVERLLDHREEARTREGRFAEERDCAYALIRWLLPVTVAKRLD